MERVNEFVFYELAIKVHAMTELGVTPVKMSECWLQLWNSRNSVDQIFTQRSLNFTGSAAWRLYQAITSIIPQKWDDLIARIPKLGDPEEPIAPWLTAEIREAAREFETVLRNECQTMDTYYVSKKGTYSTADLVANAHYQIPEPSRSGLSDQAKLDFDEAGRCMAFDVQTAAAFHLLRGTESMIRQYYELKVPGAKRAAVRMRNWGVYLRLLKTYKADMQVISVLDHLRDAYRNPVTHPEENYTDERTQVLFGICVSAVVLLVQAIASEKSKGGTLNFPPTAALTS